MNCCPLLNVWNSLNCNKKKHSFYINISKLSVRSAKALIIIFRHLPFWYVETLVKYCMLFSGPSCNLVYLMYIKLYERKWINLSLLLFQLELKRILAIPALILKTKVEIHPRAFFCLFIMLFFLYIFFIFIILL